MKATLTCYNCNKTFERRLSGNNSNHSYCTIKCFQESIYNKAIENLNTQEIIRLYDKEKIGIPTICKKFNTYQALVTKILKNAGITLRSKLWVLTNKPPFKGYKYSKEKIEDIRKKAINAYIKDPTLKQKLREKTLAQIKNGKFPNSNTSIEREMAVMLDNLNIKFEHQKIFGFWSFDFYLPDYKIFIECDGDYWHGHPDQYPEEKLNDTQKNNIKRGKQKETYALNRGCTVIRFWERDIKNKPLEIKNKLKQLTQKTV